VLALCYYGVIVMPAVARHTGEVFEPANEGLWRGIYQHKNIAGPVMAALTFGGIYLIRSGRYAIGALVTVLAVYFLLESGSKTSAGTVFLVLVLVLIPNLFGLRGAAVLFSVMIFAAFAIFTNGAVIFETVGEFIRTVTPGNTYTGRITLWEFSWSKILERPFTGYGLESLWAKPAVMQMERPYDADWDIRGIVHGHSSYLDSTLDAGIPGALVIFFALLVQPLKDYLRAFRYRANIIAADFFLMIILFTALNAFMETFFFRRGDPVWMLMVFALAGMRLIATEPLKRG
jgi:O-antigen ligase